MLKHIFLTACANVVSIADQIVIPKGPNCDPSWDHNLWFLIDLIKYKFSDETAFFSFSRHFESISALHRRI